MNTLTIQAIDKVHGKSVLAMVTIRVLHADEAMQLRGDATVLSRYYGRNLQTALLRVKINGKPKTWKTRSDVEIPVKYGLYEYAHVCYHDGIPADQNLYFVEIVSE